MQRLDALETETVYAGSNVAYICYKGKLIKRYRKRSGYNETLGGDHKPFIFIEGDKDGFFPLEDVGLACGIEICFDHDKSMLSVPYKLASQKAPPESRVHLHFITSASVRVQPPLLFLKGGGYLIHADALDEDEDEFDHTELPNLTTVWSIDKNEGTSIYDRLTIHKADKEINLATYGIPGALKCYCCTIDPD
jgi:hypothetical protein